MTAGQSSSPGTTWRTIVLVAIGALALIATVSTLPTAWAPQGVFGWTIAPDGVTVLSVTPHYPATRAGIRPGDRIIYRTLSLRARLNTTFQTPLEPGDRITFDTLRPGGTTRSVTLAAEESPVFLSGSAGTVGLLANVVSVIVGIALVALRPSIMTWAFLFYAITALVPFADNPFAARSDASVAAILALNGVLLAISTAASFVFVTRFPTNEPRAFTPWLDRIAAAWIVVAPLTVLYPLWALIGKIEPPPHWMVAAEQYVLPLLGTAIVLAVLIANTLLAQGSLRHRIIPVVTTFGLATIFNLAWTLAADVNANPAEVLAIALIAQVFNVAFPISVAYAVVRHRVFDVRFVVSRTLVYSALTATIVMSFAAVHYFVGKWLERTQVAVIIELAIAVAYGVWLNVLNSRLDRFVDRVLFRGRHLAEERLQRAEHALREAESEAFVEQTLTIEAADPLSLSSAALFRRQADGRYERRASVGWGNDDVRVLGADDRLVALLRASLAPLDFSSLHWQRDDLPRDAAQPLEAFPICERREVVAIAMYGAHRGGEALDPDEIRLLRNLARSAGAAYEHLAVVTLEHQVADLRTENAGLRQVHDALAEATSALHDEIKALGEIRAAGTPPAKVN